MKSRWSYFETMERVGDKPRLTNTTAAQQFNFHFLVGGQLACGDNELKKLPRLQSLATIGKLEKFLPKGEGRTAAVNSLALKLFCAVAGKCNLDGNSTYETLEQPRQPRALSQHRSRNPGGASRTHLCSSGNGGLISGKRPCSLFERQSKRGIMSLLLIKAAPPLQIC